MGFGRQQLSLDTVTELLHICQNKKEGTLKGPLFLYDNHSAALSRRQLLRRINKFKDYALVSTDVSGFESDSFNCIIITDGV